jgi:hypothetical protein
VFIANETGRELDETRMPAEVAASVVTSAELYAGVAGDALVVRACHGCRVRHRHVDLRTWR